MSKETFEFKQYLGPILLAIRSQNNEVRIPRDLFRGLLDSAKLPDDLKKSIDVQTEIIEAENAARSKRAPRKAKLASNQTTLV